VGVGWLCGGFLDGWKVGGQKGGSWGGEEEWGGRGWLPLPLESRERKRYFFELKRERGINGVADAEVGDRREAERRRGARASTPTLWLWLWPVA